MKQFVIPVHRIQHAGIVERDVIRNSPNEFSTYFDSLACINVRACVCMYIYT